jgi:hypothetical protein
VVTFPGSSFGSAIDTASALLGATVLSVSVTASRRDLYAQHAAGQFRPRYSAIIWTLRLPTDRRRVRWRIS